MDKFGNASKLHETTILNRIDFIGTRITEFTTSAMPTHRKIRKLVQRFENARASEKSGPPEIELIS